MRISLLRVAVLGLALFAVQPEASAQATGNAELDALQNRVLAHIQSGKYSDALPLAEQYLAGVKARFGENAAEYATALNIQATLLGAANRFLICSNTARL